MSLKPYKRPRLLDKQEYKEEKVEKVEKVTKKKK
jgi:hypothetical protein